MSTKREHKPTSKEGEAFIKPHKSTHYEKIKDGLEKLKVGGTHEEISSACGLKEQQVWKRLSELERRGDIFNTGITRKLKSSVNGIVWQLSGMPISTEIPKVEKESAVKKKIQQRVHNPLFDNLPIN